MVGGVDGSSARVGLPVPTTRDELVEVYKAFRDQDANGNGDPNDEVPVSGREGMRWLDDLFTIHGVSMMEGWPRLAWDAEKKEMISHQVSPEMKQTIEFLRMLTAEGLMDPVMPIQKKQDWVAKISANQVGHYFHVVGEMEKYSAFMEQDPTASWSYLPLVSVPGVEPQQHMYGTGSTNPSFVLTTAAKDPAKWGEYEVEEGKATRIKIFATGYTPSGRDFVSVRLFNRAWPSGDGIGRCA